MDAPSFERHTRRASRQRDTRLGQTSSPAVEDATLLFAAAQHKLTTLACRDSADVTERQAAFVTLAILSQEQGSLGKALFPLLEDDNEDLSIWACGTLPVVWGRLTSKEVSRATEHLLSLAQSKIARQRAFAAAIISEVEGTDFEPHLLKLTRDKDLTVRVAASSGLARRKEPSTWPELSELALKDPHWQVRHAVIAGLGERKNPQAFKILEDAAHTEPLWFNQALIAQQLARSYGIQGLDCILRIFFRADPKIQHALFVTAFEHSGIPTAEFFNGVTNYIQTNNIDPERVQPLMRLIAHSGDLKKINWSQVSSDDASFLVSGLGGLLDIEQDPKKRESILSRISGIQSPHATLLLLRLCESNLEKLQQAQKPETATEELRRTLFELGHRSDPLIGERLMPYVSLPAVRDRISATIIASMQGRDLRPNEVEAIENLLMLGPASFWDPLSDLRITDQHLGILRHLFKYLQAEDGEVRKSAILMMAAIQPTWLRAGVASCGLNDSSIAVAEETLNSFPDNPYGVIEARLVQIMVDWRDAPFLRESGQAIDFCRKGVQFLQRCGVSRATIGALTNFVRTQDRSEDAYPLIESSLDIHKGHPFLEESLDHVAAVLNSPHIPKGIKLTALSVAADALAQRTFELGSMRGALQDILVELLLSERNDTIREKIVDIVGLRCESPSILSRLVSSIDALDEMGKLYAIRLIGKLTHAYGALSHDAIDNFQLLIQKHKDASFRIEALRASSEMGQEILLDAVTICVADANSRVRQQTFDSVKRGALLGSTHRSNEPLDLILSRMEIGSIIMWLAKHLQGKDQELRAYAAQTLVELFEQQRGFVAL